MNDLLEKKAFFWRSRLKKCIEGGKFSQASFASALNSKYGTCYGQKDVSRWLNPGAKIRNGEIGFPKYDTMVLIADFFQVDIGYLTGETSENSFSLEKACYYLGLKSESIKAIRKITQPETEDSHIREDMRESINRFLSAERFSDFFHSLYALHITTILPKREHREFKNLDCAINYIRNLEYESKIGRYELNEALVILINEIYPNITLSDLSIQY